MGALCLVFITAIIVAPLAYALGQRSMAARHARFYEIQEAEKATRGVTLNRVVIRRH